MNRKTRLFLLLAGGVLVAGIGVGLVASYLGLPALAIGGGRGPDELKYIPEDARLVAFVDVRELIHSEFRHEIMARGARRQRQSDELQAHTGINPDTDIDSVVVGVAGSTANPRERALVLARGRFDAVTIEHLLRGHDAVASEYKGTRVLARADANGLESGFAFLEPDLLAFGALAAVKQAIDVAAGGASIKSHDQVMGLVRGVQDGHMWAVGRFDALTARANVPRGVLDRLPPIAWFAASGRVNGGIEGSVRAEARDETAAADLRDVIQGFVALARLQAGGRTAMNDVVNSLQLIGDGKTVSLRFSVSAATVAALAAERPRPGTSPQDLP